MSLPIVPDELDINFYRINNPDIHFMSDEELCNHYIQIGLAEGRPCAAASCREYFVQIAGHHSSILEIGPFYRPSLIGPNVSYFDVLNSEGLRTRAQQLGLPQDNVPLIHYVSPTGDLSIIPKTFLSVYSAHVIEHQTCLVSHLQQVSRLLTDGGFYFLIIPDKRYCFDHFIGESTIADILDAFYNQRCIHTLCSYIEHSAFTTHNNAHRHWHGDHEDPGFQESRDRRVQSAVAEYNTKRSQGVYIDVHAWQFTPTSFRSIIKSLHSLGLLDLYPVAVYETPYRRQEFTAVLTKIKTQTSI